MRSLISLLKTLVCAFIILVLGYFGIVESGRKILKSEGVPEKAEYENAGSNIFYGKIEDDIEIFPWNYYANGGKGLERAVPSFLEEEQFRDTYDWEVIPADTMEFATDWYFGEMIAYEAQVEVDDVCRWFQENQKHIYHNLWLEKDTSYGNIYFYQENMELGGEEYQVRIACSDWNVISFICAPYGTVDQREQEEWKQGKESMVSVLEGSENVLEDYVAYMREIEFMSVPVFYYDDEDYVNAYLRSLQLLDYLMLGKGGEEQGMLMEEIRESVEAERLLVSQEKGAGEELHYSYQVVELKDMILLLVQGDGTIGIYYDPINQAFCGYNYFYEY